MAQNYGKAFEQSFKKDVMSTVKDCFVHRLPDQQSGYYGTSTNPCDFIVYKYPNLFFIEVKSIQGNTFNFQNLRQYAKLVKLDSVNGFTKGVIIWFRDHDKIIYVTIDEITKMMKNKKKSINITTLKDEEYKYIEIPTVKKRIFLEGDYSVVFDNGEE